MDSPSNHEDNTAKDAPSQLAPEPYPAINDGSNSDSQSLPIRETVGNSMDRFTEIVNNNLIAARFGAFATITLLTVYGISQTPLFFRYRTVSEVPASYFIGRRRLYGRIIGVGSPSADNAGTSQSIQLQVRHLSPIGLILPKSWFDFIMRFSPQATRLGKGTRIKPEENMRDLLRIKIAGIQKPPTSRESYQPERFLERIARERAMVSIQLMARQVPDIPTESSNASKREMSTVMPELLSENDQNAVSHQSISRKNSQQDGIAIGKRDPSYYELQEAICRITYRPNFFQLFSTDIAEHLIANGMADVSTTILGGGGDSESASSVKIVDSSQRLSDLRKDAKYLDRLTVTEFQAANQSRGMWTLPEVRQQKKDIVDEVEFQTKASWYQKVWRWIRGG